MSPAAEKKIIEYGLPVLLALFLIAGRLADAYYFPGGTTRLGEAAEILRLEDERASFEREQKQRTGLMSDEKGTYYIREDGSRYIGWMYTQRATWYFDEDGYRVKSGLVSADGRTSYLENNVPVTGWKTVDGKLFLFGEDGNAETGFADYEGRQIFLLQDGGYAQGDLKIGVNMYHFEDDGSFKDGWDGDRYYRFGYMVTGYRVLEGVGRYFREDGTLARDCQIDIYDIDADGIAVNRFETITQENLAEYTEYLFGRNGSKMWDIYCYVRYNFAYVYREEADKTESVLRMLNTGLGSCYDYAALCEYLYTAAGYECVQVRGKGTFHEEHAWVLLHLPNGVWRHVDPIWQKAEVYCLTDEELRALDADPELDCTYQWNPDDYPKVE